MAGVLPEAGQRFDDLMVDKIERWVFHVDIFKRRDDGADLADRALIRFRAAVQLPAIVNIDRFAQIIAILINQDAIESSFL